MKFGDGEDEDTELIEHASMTLAAQCGIQVAATRVLPVAGRHAIAIRRFDRQGETRIPTMSAHVALRAVGEEFSYPSLAQLFRRLSPPAEVPAMQEQLFRRMVFNILMDNTDDHEKNHGLLRDGSGKWSLSPAYDVVPSASGLGYQAMRVGEEGEESSIQNAFSSAAAFGLKPRRAQEIAGEVAGKVDRWRAHFESLGVKRVDIDVLEQYIDGASLGGQRRALLAGAVVQSMLAKAIEVDVDDESSLQDDRPRLS